MELPVLHSSHLTDTSTVSPATLGFLVEVGSGAPTEWEWTAISTPLGRGELKGTNGDFVEGVALVANPRIYCFLPGGYSFLVRARNTYGWSQAIGVSLNALDGDVTKTPEETDEALAAVNPVADLTALAAVNAAGLVVGSRRFVASVNDTYTLTAGVYVADGLEVIAALGTAHYWIADIVGRWDDLQGDVSQGTAAAALTYEAYRDTPFKMYFFRHNQNDSLNMRFQFPHGVDKTCSVTPHLHVIPMSAPGAAENIRLVGQYAWAPAGVACPANVGWTTFGPLIVPFSAADQFEENIINLVDALAVPGGFKGSDILFVYVKRDGTDPTDTYNTGKVGGTAAANIGLASLDVHYRKASNGSVTAIPT